MVDVPVTFKLYGTLILHLLTVFYNNFSNPSIRKLDRRLQQINEFMVGVSVFLLLPLTEWNTEATNRYIFSWFLILLVQLMVFINMTVVMWMSLSSIKLLIKKYWALGRKWIKKLPKKTSLKKKEEEEPNLR